MVTRPGGLHAPDHLGHGRAGDVEPLGDPGLDDVDVVLAQLEDGLAVLLERRVALGGLVLGHRRSLGASADPPAESLPFWLHLPAVDRALGATERCEAPRGQSNVAVARRRYRRIVALERFSPPVRAWFETTFAEPTAAQAQGWPAIAAGDHTLILAPTGSGKTLAAFLWGIDRLVSTPPPADEARRTRLLYISPLRALAVDVEKNLRAPLQGIGLAAERLGDRRSTSRPSACAPATRPPTSAAGWCATRPTSSSPRPSRST